MRKYVTLAVMALALGFAMTGCSDKRAAAVKSFSDNFAKNAAENNMDSLKACYPAVEMADEVELTYNPDSIAVSGTDAEGVYDVVLGGGVSMVVAVAPDNKITVKETRGLFKYPAPKMKFARATGAVKGSMTDEKLATAMATVDNMATDMFNEYVASRKNAIKNLGLTVTKDIEFMMDEGKGYYTLKNTTDQPISGDEYSVTWECSYIGVGGEDVKKQIMPGKDIPANGTVRLDISFNGHYSETIKAITMNTPSQESFFKSYAANGNEYADYVKTHGEAKAGAGKLSDGPYELAGKLGGKMAIHVNIDKGMKHGSYYYDKYGPSNTLELSVKAFNPRTGELTLEESNDKGQVTGSFVGTLSDRSYTGTMTSYTGKSYAFDLAVK